MRRSPKGLGRGRDLQETRVRRMSGRTPARQRPREVPLTVVAIDGGAAHELTRMAVEHTLRVIEPEQVLILTDDPKKIAISADVDYRQFAGKKRHRLPASPVVRGAAVAPDRSFPVDPMGRPPDKCGRLDR